MTNPAIIERPKGSCRINKSGGLSQPVKAGEIRRAIQPDGVIKNAKPNAAAACGTDRSGDNSLSRIWKDRVPDHPAVINGTIVKEMDVAIKPVINDNRDAAPRPCQSNSVRNGSSDGPDKSAAGK